MKPMRERFHDRMYSAMPNESEQDIGWSQDAYRVITQEIWDTMPKKPDNVDHEMFIERARAEHAKVEHVEMNGGLEVLKTVAYDGKHLEGEELRQYVIDHIIHAEYWHCGDERSFMLFLDFTIGLTDEEKLTLSKDVRYVETYRSLVTERWNALFG
jgi:hypothetical protein